MDTYDGPALRASLDQAVARLEPLQTACFQAKQAYDKQAAEVASLRRLLRTHPARLYWSNVSEREWPLDLVYLVTDYCNLGDKLYTGGAPSLKLLIRPSARAALHVKYMFHSAAVAPYQRLVRHWMETNNALFGEKRPKWKRCVRAPSLRAMAAQHETYRFTVGDTLVLTLLGPNALVEVSAGAACRRILAALPRLPRYDCTHFDENGAPTRLCVAYKPSRPGQEILFGGRRGNQRLVKCTLP